ncbi:MAG: hypothetical protein WBA13_20880 [Microcoleaceae cyanobacterium]
MLLSSQLLAGLTQFGKSQAGSDSSPGQPRHCSFIETDPDL